MLLSDPRLAAANTPYYNYVFFKSCRLWGNFHMSETVIAEVPVVLYFENMTRPAFVSHIGLVGVKHPSHPECIPYTISF